MAPTTNKRLTAAAAICRSGDSFSLFACHRVVRGVQLPVPIQVHVQWRSGVDLSPDIRERILEELNTLSWELSQVEALLDDATRVAGQERAYLMPRIELRLPLYDAGRRLRIVFSHLDAARIHLVDEEGKRLADVAIV